MEGADDRGVWRTYARPQLVGGTGALWDWPGAQAGSDGGVDNATVLGGHDEAGPALKGGGHPAAVFSGPLLGNRWSFGRMERGLLLLSCAPAETPDQFRLVCVSLGSDYSQYTCGSWQYSS